jgi:hypothetical protein
MWYKFSALALLLTFAAANVLANGDSTVKGTVTKFDGKAIKLKTGSEEKDYKAGKEVLLVFPDGEKIQASLKDNDPLMLPEKRVHIWRALGRALRGGNEVELVLANDMVKEVHVIHMAAGPADQPHPPTKKGMPK